MAPVARRLACGRGVLEPIQTATGLEAQVEELRSTLRNHAALPLTVIGFSWGAWLGFLLASLTPAMIRKLILVGSGPFEPKYAARIHATRSARLGTGQKAAFESLTRAITACPSKGKDRLLEELLKLTLITDTYDPIPDQGLPPEALVVRGDVFEGVWQEAARLRSSGALLQLGRRIRCPVVALHGDFDPHPAEGVREPLSAVLKSFRFILLENCGHRPWIERQARDQFYSILEKELDQAASLPGCRQ